jgi:DNA-binding transcriptional MerR regulator
MEFSVHRRVDPDILTLDPGVHTMSSGRLRRMLLPEVHVDEPVTISAAADMLGITVDTIRYYEKEGIAPAPARGSEGWRRYDTSALSWLAGTVMLRGTGMNVQEMREYAAAYRAGADDAERLALLEQHHAAVLERQAEVQWHLGALERKIVAYRQTIAARNANERARSAA